MLAYLDRLCAALLARDAAEIMRLLGHPLAGALPAGVREEALAIARAGTRGFRAPMQTLRLYHQTTHLLGVCSDPATREGQAAPRAAEAVPRSQATARASLPPTVRARPARGIQIELALGDADTLG